MKIGILTCVYNDWAAAQALFPLLDDALQRAGLLAELLVVDDGSSEPTPGPHFFSQPSALTAIKILQLRKNLGHQRAIAVGLAYIYDHMTYDAIVVMDADGEDKPSDVIRLIQAMRLQTLPAIVFAERSKRSETALFTFFYHIYRLMHVILTGRGIRVGNFSVIPSALLQGLVVDMNLWHHYAACVFISKARTATIPASRGLRLKGKSKLGFTSLVVHGLSAISCYNEIISVRLLICTSVTFVAVFLALVLTAGVRFFSHLTMAGWATYAAGIMALALLQLLLFSLILATTLLGDRKHQPFIPIRDYPSFIANLLKLYPHDA